MNLTKNKAEKQSIATLAKESMLSNPTAQPHAMAIRASEREAQSPQKKTKIQGCAKTVLSNTPLVSNTQTKTFPRPNSTDF
jgi:hypothetical protein